MSKILSSDDVCSMMWKISKGQMPRLGGAEFSRISLFPSLICASYVVFESLLLFFLSFHSPLYGHPCGVHTRSVAKRYRCGH